MAYMLPQVVINQLFSEVPLNVIQDQNVLVFGPNYQIMKGTDEASKAELALGHYDGSSVVNGTDTMTYGADGDPMEFDYPGRPYNTEVDTGSVRLVGDNVRVLLVSSKGDGGNNVFTPGFTKLDDSKSGDDVDGRLKLNVVVAGADGKRDSAFGRSIRVGDVLVIHYEDSANQDAEFPSKIIEVFESSKGSGRYDCVRIADAIPADILPSGDSATSRVYENHIDFVTDLDGVEIPRKGAESYDNYQWTAGDGKFYINGNLGDGSLVVSYAEWDGDYGTLHDIISADLYLEYRAITFGAADNLHSISNNDDVYSALGDVVPENPLAYGVWKTLQNSADRLVYYMATRGETREDYARVLDAATKTDKVYILVPLTSDQEVIDDVVSHVDSMSTGRNKLWRIAFINHAVPETNTLYTEAASTDGLGFKVSVSGDIARFVDAAGNMVDAGCMDKVVAGDSALLYFDSSVDVYTGKKVPVRYKIDRVLNNSQIRIVVPEDDTYISGLGSGKVRIEVEHVYSEQEKTAAVSSASRRYMDRRVYNVFPTWYQTADGETVSGVFLACACAGLASSVLPQQPITNVEINGIADVPVCYETFSRDQLNEIAEGGTFIVMQDLPGDRVYVRHQISTEYGSNNLLKSELSVTKNLDSISYYFAEIYRPLVGRYNITPKLLLVIRNMAENALSKLERDTAVGLVGPQVLKDGTEITALYQDPVNQDHVYMELKLNLPRPFNVLDLNLEVI